MKHAHKKGPTPPSGAAGKKEEQPPMAKVAGAVERPAPPMAKVAGPRPPCVPTKKGSNWKGAFKYCFLVSVICYGLITAVLVAVLVIQFHYEGLLVPNDEPVSAMSTMSTSPTSPTSSAVQSEEASTSNNAMPTSPSVQSEETATSNNARAIKRRIDSDWPVEAPMVQSVVWKSDEGRSPPNDSVWSDGEGSKENGSPVDV